VGKKIVVRGKLESSRGRSHVVAAWILGEEKVLAEARATFMIAS
jgi:hypothetical protein